MELQHRVKTEARHPGLFDLFLEVRNAASAIVDRTSLADLVERNRRVLAARDRRGVESGDGIGRRRVLKCLVNT